MKITPQCIITQLFFVLLPVIIHAQSFPVTGVTVSGPLTNRVNIAVLPDGYTSAELPNFIQGVGTISDTIFSKSPFKEYRNFFNIYAIEVPSVESGSDHPATATDVIEPIIPFADVNTYFDTQFDGFNTHRFVVTNNTANVYTVLANNFPSYDQILVLVNSTEYGGTGGAISTVSMDPNAPLTTVHELGHSFAGLSDEYWAGWGSETPNMTMISNPNAVVWHNWVGVNNVSVYQHFGFGGPEPWYKPANYSCMMENLSYPFCSVCEETVISSVYDAVSPIDNALPDTMVTVNYTSSPLQFTVNLVKPDPYTLKVKWQLNGTALSGTDTTIQITGAQLMNGTNTLKAFITDTTLFSRSYWPSAGYQFSATWNISKSTTGIVEINSTDDNSRFYYKLYPIPAMDHVTIAYDNKTTDRRAAFTIVDITGRVIKHGELNLGAGKQQTNLDVSDLATGSYIFNLNGANISVETKLTKL